MKQQINDIDSRYEEFYAQRTNIKVYPTEFVVLIMIIMVLMSVYFGLFAKKGDFL